jgi:hypothetical protein
MDMEIDDPHPPLRSWDPLSAHGRILHDLRRLQFVKDLLAQVDGPLQTLQRLLTDASKSNASEIGALMATLRKSYGTMHSEFSHLQETVTLLHTLGQRITRNTTQTKPRSVSIESGNSPEPPPAGSSTITHLKSASDVHSGVRSIHLSPSDYSKIRELLEQALLRMELVNSPGSLTRSNGSEDNDCA